MTAWPDGEGVSHEIQRSEVQFSDEAGKMNFSFFLFFPSSLSFLYTFILMF